LAHFSFGLRSGDFHSGNGWRLLSYGRDGEQSGKYSGCATFDDQPETSGR
jgi:hypothetical protein